MTRHDDYHDLGLGTILTNYLIEIARAKKLLKIDLKWLHIIREPSKSTRNVGTRSKEPLS